MGKNKKTQVTAWAPATVANVAVGFDILGFAIKEVGDTVRVRRTVEPIVKIKKIDAEYDLPMDAEKNTATAGLIKMRQDLQLSFGFEVEIKKGIPKGSGMGGSAASSVAAVLAANALLDKPLAKRDLLPYAIEGEFIASGSRHADNVAPCLLGGFTLIQRDHRVVPVPAPRGLQIIVLNPGFELETKKAREVLPQYISLKDHIHASSHLAGFLLGCFLSDVALLSENFKDVLIEPYRAPLVRGYKDIQAAALNEGAWGAAMAGAGPSLFAWCAPSRVKVISQSMLKAARKAGHSNSRLWTSTLNKVGAQVLK